MFTLTLHSSGPLRGMARWPLNMAALPISHWLRCSVADVTLPSVWNALDDYDL